MLKEEIGKECDRFGKKLAILMKANLDEALRKGGRKLPQEAALNFKENIEFDGEDIKIQIIAVVGEKPVDYWAYIEKGVDGTKVKHGSPFSYKKKAVDFDAMESWIKKSGLKSNQILAEIKLKARKKQGLSSTPNTLSRSKRGLSYDAATKQLSRIFAVAKARDGSEAKPFVQQAITESKPEEFQKRISEIIGREIAVELSVDNKTTPIKLTF